MSDQIREIIDWLLLGDDKEFKTPIKGSGGHFDYNLLTGDKYEIK